MIDYFRTIELVDNEEDKPEKTKPDPDPNPIDFGLGSVTYWGVSRFLFSIILSIGLFCSSCFLKNAMGQDLYSHMVTPMNVPESYGESYRPLPLPYFNPCYGTVYNDFYLKQLYYDSVYKYIYDRTHSNNNFTIRRTN